MGNLKVCGESMSNKDSKGPNFFFHPHHPPKFCVIRDSFYGEKIDSDMGNYF